MVGMTYLASALLSLVLKNLVGRRLLLLTSQLGMAVSHLGLGLYFHQLPDTEEEMEESGLTWLPLPLVLAFTVSYNLGLGSLTWVVATEVLPIRSRLNLNLPQLSLFSLILLIISVGRCRWCVQVSCNTCTFAH